MDIDVRADRRNPILEKKASVVDSWDLEMQGIPRVVPTIVYRRGQWCSKINAKI